VIDTSDVNTSAVGTYSVTYDVNDSAGNRATKTRTVNVIDSDWYEYEEDGETATYTTEGNISTSVSIPSGEFKSSLQGDKIVLKSNRTKNIDGCEIRTSITISNNGQVDAGFLHEGGRGCSNDMHEDYAPGTIVTIDNNGMIHIETPLINDINFGEE